MNKKARTKDQLEAEIRSLQKERDTYIDIFNTSMNSISIHDINGNLFDANPAYLSLLGYTLNELKEMKYADITPKKWHDKEAKIVNNQIMKNGFCDEYEKEYIRKDGSIIPVSVKVWTIKDKKDKPVRFGAMVRDITERKNAEKELLQSEERLHSFIESSTEGFYLFDSELNYLMINKKGLKFFPAGTRSEDIVGRNLQDFVPDLKESELYKKYHEVIRTGKPFYADDITPHPIYGKIFLNVRAFKVGDCLGMVVSDVTDRRKTELALQQSEEKFRLIAENVTEGIYQVDLEGKILYVNNIYEKMFGYEPQELIGKQFSILIPERLIPEAHENMKALFSGEVQKGEFLVKHKDGHEFPGYYSMGPLLKEGKLVGLSGIVEDISERKQAEEALKHSEKRLRDLTAITPTYIYEIDSKGTIIFVNRTYPGLTRKDVEGTLLTSWYPDDLKEKIKSTVDAVIATRKARKIEYSIQNPEGELLSYSVDVSPRIVNDQKVTVVWTSTDITELKRNEEALKENTERFKNAIVNAPFPIMIHAEGGEVLQLSKTWTEITGYTPEDIPTIYEWAKRAYGKNELDEEAIGVINKVYELRGRERQNDGEWPIITSTGEERIWNFSTTPLGTHTDGRRIVISMATDVTERKQAEEKVKTALQEKEVLLRELHHRTKNNMQVIASLLKLRLSPLKNDRVDDILKQFQSYIRSMAMVHEKLYRTEDFRNVDFAKYVRELANGLFRNYGVAREKIALSLDLDPVLLPIDLAVPCGLIINELISNVCKYAFPDDKTGTVTVSLKTDEYDDVYLTIADNGIGIPGTIDLKNAGTLGLELVHTMVTKQLRGSIDLERDGGTTFRIVFSIQDKKEILTKGQ